VHTTEVVNTDDKEADSWAEALNRLRRAQGQLAAVRATYDLALIAYLHLPWPDMAQVLTRAATAVGKGGTLLLVGHDAANPEHGHGGPQDPRVLYTAEQVADLWRPHADILRAETAARPVTAAEGDNRTALDALVHAVRR
jgi:hypothetical protein